MITATANQVMGNGGTIFGFHITHIVSGYIKKRPLESFKTKNYSQTYKFDIILQMGVHQTEVCMT